MKKSFCLIFFVLLFNLFFNLIFILVPGRVDAFVPEAPHLLHLVIQKIKKPVGIKILQIKKKLDYKDAGKGYIELEEKLIYSYPNQLRIDIVSNTMTSFSVESDFRFVKVMDGLIVSHEKSLTDLYTDILLYRDYESLLNQLDMAGIDTTKVSLQRFNDTICYVIGRPSNLNITREERKPFVGLWIERQSLLPFKYVVEKNGLMVEFFYNNWQRASKTWYPMQISIFVDNQLFAMIQVKSFDLQSGFAKKLFDIDYIKRLYPENKPDFSDENLQQIDELDRRLEEFKKLYE